MSLPTILSSKPIHANPFFAEGSFMTDVEQFLHFFEVDAQFITEVVDKEAEVTKVHVENVNAFIVVVGNALALKYDIFQSKTTIFCRLLSLRACRGQSQASHLAGTTQFFRLGQTASGLLASPLIFWGLALACCLPSPSKPPFDDPKVHHITRLW